MASVSATKRFRTSSDSSEIRKQGKEAVLPWNDIAPAEVAEWMETYSKANNTTRDILLASVLPSVASLMGPSTIKVNCRLQGEAVNLFMICLCEPGAGKSPAFQHGCAQPIRLHVEAKEEQALFVDEFTEAGLFRQLQTAPGHKAIIGKEEVSQLFDQLLGASREKSKIDMERLIQLFDGSTWVYTRGDKAARRVIDCPGVSLSGYSQPNRFFPIYVRLKERRDGAVDRMLMYQPMPHRLSAGQTREFITKLNNSPVKDLRAIYSSIYTFSHSENGPASYSLDQTGNAAYERFIDAIAESLNSQWRKNSCTDDVSKDDRHVLRLAVILHVFYDQLKKGLRGEDPTPPSGVVTLTTLQQAIALCKYFTVQRRILDQLLTANTPGTANDFDKQKRILLCKGPFASVRLAQTGFGGSSRPSSSAVVAIMQNLAKDGFGKVLAVERSTVLFKKVPSSLTDEVLAKYGLTKDQYREAFVERADRGVISREQFNKFLDLSPDKDELFTLHSITREEPDDVL